MRPLESIAKWYFDKIRPPYNTDKELAKVDTIIGLSMGLAIHDMGAANQALAIKAYDLSRKNGTPLILQWEIAESLEYFQRYDHVEIGKHRIAGLGFDTAEVIARAAEICRKHRFKSIALLAHPDHVWRCWRVARKIFSEVKVVNTSTVPYPTNSVQPWTINRTRFFFYEIGASILFFAQRKI